VSANGVELRGLGKTPQDVVLVYDNSAGTPGPDAGSLCTGRSGTMMVTGDDFLAENLTICERLSKKRHERTNKDHRSGRCTAIGGVSAGALPGISEHLYCRSNSAIRRAGRATCDAARQYYATAPSKARRLHLRRCEGCFDRCEIHTMPHVMDTIYGAEPGTGQKKDSGYVFRDCNGDPRSPGSQDILLGRPWRAYSTCHFSWIRLQGSARSCRVEGVNGALATQRLREYDSHGEAGGRVQSELRRASN